MAASQPSRRWRYEDLAALPDGGRRHEIVEGELHELPLPSLEHATAGVNLLLLFAPMVTQLRARIFAAPLDVFFARANPVRPDLLVLLPDRLALISKRGIEGPPSLVVEILSPADLEWDRTTKRALYARVGVLEYWLVSPEDATIEILALAGDAYRTHVRAAGDETVGSLLLQGLSFPAAAAFAPGAARAAIT